MSGWIPNILNISCTHLLPPLIVGGSLTHVCTPVQGVKHGDQSNTQHSHNTHSHSHGTHPHSHSHGPHSHSHSHSAPEFPKYMDTPDGGQLKFTEDGKVFYRSPLGEIQDVTKQFYEAQAAQQRQSNTKPKRRRKK